jgi:serine/threonine protein kinase
MEECDGDFSSYMKTRSSYWFGIEEIYDFASQIVNGYLYLKSLNIMHRNLIPKNILYKKLFDNRLLYKVFPINN